MSSQSQTGDRDGTGESELHLEFECPLCELTTDTQTDVYRHLMVSHRKSAVSRALIETSDNKSTIAPTLNS